MDEDVSPETETPDEEEDMKMDNEVNNVVEGTRFISENLTKGWRMAHTRNVWGGGNMKTHVAVYEEPQF